MPLHVEIVTPRGAALTADADEVVAPGVLGELGVLAGHRPLLSGVRPGVLRLRAGATVQLAAVGAGFLEVGGGDKVLILVDSCEQAHQVDIADARRDLAEADDKLRAWSRATGPEYEGVLAARAWADARIRVYEAKAS